MLNDPEKYMKDQLKDASAAFQLRDFSFRRNANCYRKQFKMVESMERQMDAMQQIMRECK